MTNFTPVKSNEKINISASEWNDVRKSVYKPNLKKDVPKHQTGFVTRPVKVRNGQPESVPMFGVLRIQSGLESRQTDDLYEQASEGIGRGIEVDGIPPTGDENETLCILQRPSEEAQIQPCIVMGATLAWVFVNSTEHRYAKAIPDNVQMLESADSGSVRLMHPAPSEGLQLLPVLLGFPDKTEPAINAKELFPAVIYRNGSVPAPDSGSGTLPPLSQTYIVCPGVQTKIGAP